MGLTLNRTTVLLRLERVCEGWTAAAGACVMAHVHTVKSLTWTRI